jgi:hypothetical protein
MPIPEVDEAGDVIVAEPPNPGPVVECLVSLSNWKFSPSAVGPGHTGGVGLTTKGTPTWSSPTA